MRFVQQMSAENQYEIQTYRHVPKFVPAGQSTQMIIGATPESDYQILHVAESLYKKFDLKRVFYSAFIPVNEDKNLPSVKEQATSSFKRATGFIRLTGFSDTII